MRLMKIITGLTALLLLSACGKKENTTQAGSIGNQQENYPVEILQKQDVELQTVYPAIIRGEEDIAINPRVDGFIEAVYVDEGSVVKKGQILFKINSPASEQALATAMASVTSAQASLNTALLDVQRMRPLAEKNIISGVQLQSYENAYVSAQANVQQAEANVRNARATLSWTNVVSPVDGVVGTIPYRQGSLVSSSNTLTTVANIKNVFAYFSINEKNLLELLMGLPGTTQEEKIKNLPEVQLVLANGSAYPEAGRIETISGVVNTTTGSANFRAEFPNPSGLLRSGSSGKVIIPRIVRDVFVIPQKATFSLQDKVLVYQVQSDSVIQKNITVESTPDGQYYAVTSGLAVGDTVVVDGVATLSNGKKIKVQPQNNR